MNPHLAELLKRVTPAGVSDEQLSKALRLIRAHWSLAGISLISKRLCKLAARFDPLKDEVDGQSIQQEWETLGILANLDPADGSFHTGRLSGSSAIPLRGHTGESCLSELLLIDPPADAKGLHRESYDQLVAWFAWQTFRFQFRVEEEARYFRYLRSTEESHEIAKKPGYAAYKASLVLRDLADVRGQNTADFLARRHAVMSEQGSEALTLYLRLMTLKWGAPASRRYLDYAAQELSQDEETVREVIRHFEPEASVDRYSGHPVSDLGRFLALIYLPSLECKLSARRRRSAEIIDREVRRPRVARYGNVVEQTSIIDDGVHSGTSVEIHLRRQVDHSKESQSHREALGEPEPDDVEGAEPDIALYLADGDPIGGYYAARAASHHIERANALLPFAAHRISEESLQLVIRKLSEAPANPSAELGYFFLGLMLISGRPLDEVMLVEVWEGPLDLEKALSSMAIDLSRGRLHVRAGAPHLQKPPEASALLHPRAEWISIGLPLVLLGLARGQSSLRRFSSNKRDQVLLLIEGFPIGAGISQKSIQHALRFQLLDLSEGDLGILKVVTDATEANAANVIHYFSAQAIKVEQIWQDIVDTWFGPSSLGTKGSLNRAGQYVGAPEALVLDRLVDHVKGVRDAYQDAITAGDTIRAANNLAIYLSLWCGLATAGRKTLQPIPRWIRSDGWALVQDKSRADESTDRLIPLTPGVLSQIDVYRALLQTAAIYNDGVAESLRKADPTIPLLFFKASGEVIPYQPKWRDQRRNIGPIPPPNWARKLIRSSTVRLAPRYRDAGLGHFMRGRHPWSLTSTFRVSDFRQQWLETVEHYERVLGFELLDPLGYIPPAADPSLDQIRAAAPSAGKSTEEVRVTKEEIETAMRKAAPDLYRYVFEEHPAVPAAALGLVTATLRAKQLSRPKAIAFAKAATALIQERAKIPIFVAAARKRFQREWMVSELGFALSTWCTSSLLPRFREELSLLPEARREDSPQVSLGRLILVLIFRLGLVCYQHLLAMIEWIRHVERPVLAIQEARIVILEVTYVRSKEKMQRTVHLDAWTSAYLALERSRLIPMIPLPKNRRTIFQKATDSYLQHLGIRGRPSLAELLAMGGQEVLVHAGPLLLGYASGQIFTEDAGDRQLRRLAGLVPARERSVIRSTSAITPIERKEFEDEEEDPSSALKAMGAPLIALPRSALFEEWLRVFRLAKPTTAAQKIVIQFGIFLVERLDMRKEVAAHSIQLSEGAGGARSASIATDRATKDNREDILTKLRLVERALAASRLGERLPVSFDEDRVSRLADITEIDVPSRVHHGAWNSFREFLRSGNHDPELISVGRVDAPSSEVSALLLSQDEIRRCLRLVESPRSGIGNTTLRLMAARHFALLAEGGMRRAEAEGLRAIDHQGDCIRVQPYGNHTLKTPAAERLIPEDLLSTTTQEFASGAKARKTRLIQLPELHSDADNYLPALNRMIKEATGDPDVSLHILRHSRATRWVLAALMDPDALGQLPPTVARWIDLSEQDARAVRLIMQGRGGHGLQAISMLLGHIHPTTTLRHYVHGLGLALHAAMLRNVEDPNLARSLRWRFSSRPTVDRIVAKVEGEPSTSVNSAGRTFALRDAIEAWAQKLDSSVTLVDVDERELALPELMISPDEDLGDPDHLSLSRLDSLHRAMKHDVQWPANEPIARERILESLEQLACIPTGKRGSASRRHPLPEKSHEGLPLPALLAAGDAVANAAVLVNWLETLRKRDPSPFRWLLDRWRHATTGDGLIGLASEDIARLHRLRAHLPRGLELKLEYAAIAANRRSVRTKVSEPRVKPRVRILFPRGERPSQRSAGPVRWVMTWVCVIDSALNMEPSLQHRHVISE